MKPLVNLAHEPFRNRRLFWLFILLLFFVPTVVGVNNLSSISELDFQIAALEPRVKEAEARVKKIEGEAPAISSLTPAQNQSLLAAQDLITRKSFSWSQLLNDLEQYVPPTVRVLRIGVDRGGQREREGRPVPPGRRKVYLAFEVVGKSPTEVTRMIGDMNRSDLFSVRPRSMKPVEGTEEVQFTLDVEYQPPAAPARTALNGQIAAEGGR
jgi:cell division protein FtsB